MPRSLARASDRASKPRSTLTEITFTPSPLRGRPGFRRALSHAFRSAAVKARDLSMTISESNRFVTLRSSWGLIRRYVATTCRFFADLIVFCSIPRPSYFFNKKLPARSDRNRFHR